MGAVHNAWPGCMFCSRGRGNCDAVMVAERSNVNVWSSIDGETILPSNPDDWLDTAGETERGSTVAPDGEAGESNEDEEGEREAEEGEESSSAGGFGKALLGGRTLMRITRRKLSQY